MQHEKYALIQFCNISGVYAVTRVSRWSCSRLIYLTSSLPYFVYNRAHRWHFQFLSNNLDTLDTNSTKLHNNNNKKCASDELNGELMGKSKQFPKMVNDLAKRQSVRLLHFRVVIINYWSIRPLFRTNFQNEKQLLHKTQSMNLIKWNSNQSK